MIANGERRRLVKLDRPGASVPDGDGGYVEGWEPLSPPTAYAKINAATQADMEKTAAGTTLSMQTHIIEMLFHRGVNTKTRIRFRDRDRERVFQVSSVRNPNEDGRELVIVAEEIVE
jgi:head-tail adaptor